MRLSPASNWLFPSIRTESSPKAYIPSYRLCMVSCLLIKNQKLIFTFGGWAFATLVVLAILDNISFESFFVICLIGFILITMLSGPYIARPRWRSRVNIVVLAGVVVFLFIVTDKALNILGINFL